MAKKKYPDGTHRAWVRIDESTEWALREYAVEQRVVSVEVFAGQLLREAITARLLSQHKAAVKASRKARK